MQDDGEGEGGEASDEALFRAYVAGDQSAFGQLFDRYAPLLGRLIGRRVPDPELARDLVQQAFLQLHRARADFRADGKLRPWLYTISLNVVRRHFRRKRRFYVEWDERSARLPSHAAHDPVAADEARRLHAALGQLPGKQREAIELHWLEGLSFAEVAEVVGASEGAVKVRAHRGYERLRGLLGDIARNQMAADRLKAEETE